MRRSRAACRQPMAPNRAHGTVAVRSIDCAQETTMSTTTPPSARPATDRSYALPPIGDNPSTDRQGTTPGSFALSGRVGTPYTFSSPDTPGMPGVSDRTAWDFLPDRWTRTGEESAHGPESFNPITQLESAR